MNENQNIEKPSTIDPSKDGGVILLKDMPQPSNTTSKAGPNSIPTSSSSIKPLPISSRTWRRPISVKEFASQINAVSTMILNRQIDIDTANVYTRLTRNFAQLMTTETVKARFLKRQPDLGLDGNVFEEDEESSAVGERG